MITTMYDDDELYLLEDLDAQLESPLDRMDPVEAAVPAPDPDEMLGLLQSADPQQRMLAARAFCQLEDPRAIAPLIELLNDTCPLVRVSAAYGLGRNPSEAAVEPLMRQVNTDLNGYVRKGAVWALGNCRDRRSLPVLIESLKTDIAAVRLWSASALAQMSFLGYDAIIAALPTLIERMRQDAMAAVRSNCAWSVGQLSAELPSNVIYATAIDALIETIVEDEDPGVRQDAKGSLLKVGDPRGLELIEALEREGIILW
jgi:HEAT repeat protein